MIDGIPIVESTILPSPNENDTSKVVSGKAAVADQIGSRDSHVEEVEKAPKEFPGISQAAKQASLPARTPADALGGRLSAKSATVPAKSSEDEKIFHNARLEGDWNNVMNKIHSQRITIVCEQTREGMTRYSVPDLSNEEQQSLAVKKFVSRTSRRLEALHGIQRKEVFRLCKWIAENGHRPEKLILDGEGSSLGEANKVIRTLWKHWQNDVDVLAAISAGIEARKTELHLPTLHAVQGSIPVPNREGNDSLSDGGADLVADGEEKGIAADVTGSVLKQSDEGMVIGDGIVKPAKEGKEEKSDSPPSEGISENTDDEEWFGTLGMFANRNGKLGRC